MGEPKTPKCGRRTYGSRTLKIVTVTIKNGLVMKIDAPKNVMVVVKDYDSSDWAYLDGEVKTDAKNRRYVEEIWEGADA